MAQSAAAYSSADVTVSIFGIDVDQSNISQDDFVTIEPQVEPFSIRVGLGGGVTYSENKGLWDKVTVRVRQCGSVNDKLAAIHLLDKNTPGGQGIGPIIVKDRNGNYKYACLQARIANKPSVKFGKEEGDFDWVLLCPNATDFVGGH